MKMAENAERESEVREREREGNSIIICAGVISLF